MTKTVLLASLLPLLLAGCEDSLVYVHEETVGIDVSVSTTGTEHLLFGYDGGTVASVPKFPLKATGPDGKPVDGPEQAMNLVSFGHTEAQGLDDILFYHIFATGEAAKSAVGDPDQLRLMRQAVNGAGSK